MHANPNIFGLCVQLGLKCKDVSKAASLSFSAKSLPTGLMVSL